MYNLNDDSTKNIINHIFYIVKMKFAAKASATEFRFEASD